jgi:hypothetical protein
MRKLTLTLTAAALALGTMALTANAQTLQPGAASLHAQLQNATPIVKVYCRGGGPNQGWACGPGFARVCSRFRCWCRPC